MGNKVWLAWKEDSTRAVFTLQPSLMLCLSCVSDAECAPRVMGGAAPARTCERDSRLSAASCQPPRPTALPPYVPPDIDVKALPIWQVPGAVWRDTGCCALTYIPAVAAKIFDVVSTAKGGGRRLNFTPRQWQTVRSLPPVAVWLMCVLRLLVSKALLVPRTHAGNTIHGWTSKRFNKLGI
jgi:hypothetical protein